ATSSWVTCCGMEDAILFHRLNSSDFPPSPRIIHLEANSFRLLLPWEKRSCRRFYRLGGNSCVTGMRATMPDSRIGESDMRKTTENVSKRPGHNYPFDSPSSYFPK